IGHRGPLVSEGARGCGSQIGILGSDLQPRISGGRVIGRSEEFIIGIIEAEAGADGRLAIAEGIPSNANVWRELRKVLVVKPATAGTAGKTESGVAEKCL